MTRESQGAPLFPRYYKGEVVEVTKAKKWAATPVLVKYAGHDEATRERHTWVRNIDVFEETVRRRCFWRVFWRVPGCGPAPGAGPDLGIVEVCRPSAYNELRCDKCKFQFPPRIVC